MSDFVDDLRKENTVADSDYGDYIRLERQRRLLADKLTEIEDELHLRKRHIAACWQGKRSEKCGSATFFAKDSMIVSPCYGVSEKDIALALMDADMGEFVHLCPDYKALRHEFAKLNGEVPPELYGKIRCWTKRDICLRINKE